MVSKSPFLKALSKESTTRIPLYCTGYPEIEFIDNYIRLYNLKTSNTNSILYSKDYSIIKQMGFDAISLWDFRREKVDFTLKNYEKVDGWGRIYRDDWYSWDGVFKNEKIIKDWELLKLPSKEKLKILRNFLKKRDDDLEYVISLPGLFEKTWQSMGFHYFAKCLKNNLKLIKTVIEYFYNYLHELIIQLQSVGAYSFIIADDLGYKNRTFIPKEIWIKFFYDKYKHIVDLIHKNKNYIILHSDGYISDMIETFIDLKFDAIQSLESNAGVDIFALFKKFKNQICFIGNLDISLLTFGTPKQVEDYVIKLIRKALKYDSSLVVSPTQHINSKCRPVNVNAFIETAKIFK